MKNKYRCIAYDNWNSPDGWYVNDIDVVEEDIFFDPQEVTDKELYKFFARIADFKTNLRAVHVEYNDLSFIEFIYTGQSLGGFFPLGRFEQTDI